MLINLKKNSKNLKKENFVWTRLKINFAGENSIKIKKQGQNMSRIILSKKKICEKDKFWRAKDVISFKKWCPAWDENFVD